MEEEFLEFDIRNAWDSVFLEIRNSSNKHRYTIKEARKAENLNRNRYRDVNPFDHSRVCLKRDNKDYINASLVKVSKADRSYILTQGPLKSTTGHFWLMVWEQDSRAILMLNRVIERNTVKCHTYWPEGSANGGEDELVLNEVGLMVQFVSSTTATNYTIREFTLTDFQSGQSRTVLQFHYLTWPDFGVPESPGAFLNFLIAVRNAGVLSSDVGPAIVHCSAGIGRSGTFCLVDSCLVLLEKNLNLESINIRELLLEMRHYRMGLIQTPDQLRFSYMAVIEGSKSIVKNNNDNTVPSESPKLDNPISNNNERSVYESSESSADESIIVLGSKSLTPPPPLPPRPVRGSATPPPVYSLAPKPRSASAADKCNGVSEPLDNPGHPETLLTSHGLFKAAESDKINQNVEPPVATEAPKEIDSAELRRRKRKERSDRTSAIVLKIKKKQKESEQWQKRRSMFFKPVISIGVVLLIGTGYLMYRLYKG